MNATNKRGKTALILACESAQAESVEILLEMGANRDIADGKGCTSLHAAIHGRCPNETLKKIIIRKSHLDAQNMDGQTPLLLACTCRQNNSVKLLLEAGSNPNITDKNKNTSLHAAVHGRCRTKDIKAIIDHFADINAINKNKQTAIMLACEKGDVHAINVLLKNRADLNIANADGDTCLHVVARRDHSKDVIHSMIKHGANVNAKNKFNETPLMKANKNGYIDVTKELLNAGADHKLLDGFGDTWIHRAIDGGYRQELIRTMIDHGADVNAMNKHNETAFMTACKKGNVDAIKLLFSVGTNPNIKNDDGQTWIHHTVIGNWSREVLQVVMSHGGDVNATTKDNITALMLASRTGNVDTINVLLAAGADPNITDAGGYTCLHDAVDVGCNKETLKAIIDHGANINAANKKGVTPLMQAFQVGNINAISVLLDAEADLNIIDQDGDTCLHRAVRARCSKEILQSVIRCGANVNAANKSSVTALRLACQTGNKDAINELLKAGADPSIVDEAGETCLHTAIRSKCSRKHLEALITHGADVNATNENSETAIRLAYQMGNEHAINELLKAGADPNIVDEAGETCLHTAVRSKCSTDHLNVLITYVANVNATSKNCVTALRVACQMKSKDTIIALLEAGADIDIEDKNDYTFLHEAVQSVIYLEAFHAIKYHHTSNNETTKTILRALRMACQMEDVTVIKILLQTRVDFNSVDNDGDTCLHKAVRYNCNGEVLQAIINPSILSVSEIHSAMKYHHADLRPVILGIRCDWKRHGSYIHTKNKHKQTALMLARERGNTDAIHILLNAGASRPFRRRLKCSVLSLNSLSIVSKEAKGSRRQRESH